MNCYDVFCATEANFEWWSDVFYEELAIISTEDYARFVGGHRADIAAEMAAGLGVPSDVF